MAEQRIVAAVASMAGTLNPLLKPMAHAIEEAMAQAVRDCEKDGIGVTESELVRARMMNYRKLVREAYERYFAAGCPARNIVVRLSRHSTLIVPTRLAQ